MASMLGEFLKLCGLSAAALMLSTTLRSVFVILSFIQVVSLLNGLLETRAAAVTCASKVKIVEQNCVDHFPAIPSTIQLSLLGSRKYYVLASVVMLLAARVYAYVLQESRVLEAGHTVSSFTGLCLRAAMAFSLVRLVEFVCKKSDESGDDPEEWQSDCKCGTQCSTAPEDTCPYDENYWSDVTGPDWHEPCQEFDAECKL
jgi:hypothetical protein